MKESIDTLLLRLGAQRVKRYHTQDITGTQTVADHTYGMVQILRYLTAGQSSAYRVAAVEAALDHDVPEILTGDSPHPAKVAYPELKAALGKMEDGVEQEYGLSSPTGPAMKLDIKCADLLEMAHFGLRQIMMGNGVGTEVINNVGEALTKLSPSNEKAMTLFYAFANTAMEIQNGES